jgi:hypothetical protein
MIPGAAVGPADARLPEPADQAPVIENDDDG